MLPSFSGLTQNYLEVCIFQFPQRFPETQAGCGGLARPSPKQGRGHWRRGRPWQLVLGGRTPNLKRPAFHLYKGQREPNQRQVLAAAGWGVVFPRPGHASFLSCPWRLLRGRQETTEKEIPPFPLPLFHLFLLSPLPSLPQGLFFPTSHNLLLPPLAPAASPSPPPSKALPVGGRQSAWLWKAPRDAHLWAKTSPTPAGTHTHTCTRLLASSRTPTTALPLG